MPGTYPITPPRSPVVITPKHAAGFMVNNQSQASEAPATPQPLPDHDMVSTPSRAAPVIVVPEDGAAIVANNQHQASEATTTSQAQIEDATETTPTDAVYLWLNYTAPPSPKFIIPSEDPATPAQEPDIWDKLTLIALQNLSPTTPTHFRESIASASDELIESPRSSPLTTGSIASASDELSKSPRSSPLTTGSIDSASNGTIVEKQSSPSTTGSTETASNKIIISNRSPPTTEVLERMSDELIESKRSSSTTGITGATFDGSIESNRSPSPTTVTPGPMSDEHNGSNGSSSPAIETPDPMSDKLIAPNQSSTSILKRRVPLTQSANAANLGTLPPSTPKPSVKFLEDPVSRYKKFAIGEPIDFPTPTSTVDSAASSPFEELPWPPSPETLRSLGYVSQLETPTKASSHTSAHLSTESPSPPSTLEFTGFENLRIGGRRSAEEQLREEIAAYEKAKEESEAAARAKAASIARVRAAEVKDRKKKVWPSERVMQPLTVEWETKVHDALAKSASQTN